MLISKKFAAAELNSHPNMPLVGRGFYQAILSDQLPKYFLERMLHFKSYSDELPAKRLSPYDPPHKCRGATITGISLGLLLAVNEGIIQNQDLVARINLFANRDWNFKRDALATKDEIALINQMLDTVIDYLKAAYSLQ